MDMNTTLLALMAGTLMGKFIYQLHKEDLDPEEYFYPIFSVIISIFAVSLIAFGVDYVFTNTI